MRCHRETGDVKIAACMRAINSGAGRPSINYNSRGDAYRTKGDLDRAIADFTVAIRLDPKHANARPQPSPVTAVARPVRPQLSAQPSDTGDTGTNWEAKGGLVTKIKEYAIGGPVEEDDEEEAPTVTPQVTRGVTPPAMGGVTDFSAQRRTVPMPTARPAEAGPSRTVESEAAINALKHGLGRTDLPQASALPIPRNRTQAMMLEAYLKGAAVADMQAIYKKIDPDGKLPEGVRKSAALATLYKFKNDNESPEAAAKAAFQVLQHYRTQARNYAAIGAAALQEGKVDEGLKALMKMHANIPDGNDLKLWMADDGRIGWKVTDEKTGQPVTGGVARPDEVIGRVLNIASGKGFEDALIEMAGGMRGQAGQATMRRIKGTGDDDSGGYMKPSEYEGARNQISSYVDNWRTEYDKSPEKKPITDAYARQMKNAMFYIRANNRVTDDDAFDMTDKFVNAPVTYKGNNAAFRVIKDDDAGMRTIRFKDGRIISMPSSDYSVLATMRGQALQQAEEAAKKPTTSFQKSDVATATVPSATPMLDYRIALVIGNSAYENAAALPNPKRDANLVADALKHAGFKSVTLLTNLRKDALVSALRDFAARAETADWAVVYYAGHGMEVGGINYLIPTDAKIAADRDIEFEAVPLAQVLNAAERARKLRLVILDACRDNPFANQMKRTLTVASRSVSRGLAAVEPDAGTLVVYAAKDGETALDGVGINSPFATAFVKNLPTPGLEVRRLFDFVRDDVMEATGRKQKPFSYGSISGRQDFYFVAGK